MSIKRNLPLNAFEEAKGFSLDNLPQLLEPEFQLEGEMPVESTEAQTELQLTFENPEQPEFEPQLEFDGMSKPTFAITVEQSVLGAEQLHFKNAQTLLESLEAQQVQVPYQCRDGYCGACRCKKITGEVTYLKEPMAWINEDEILPCVSIPRSDLHLKFSS